MTRALRDLPLAAALVAALGGGAAAQFTGIAACDAYFRDLEACILTRVPPAERGLLLSGFEQGRAAVRQAAALPQTRPQAEEACRQMKARTAQRLAVYGCQFQ